MRRSTHLMIVLFAAVALIVVGVQGAASRPATAATASATTQATTAATARATTQATRAATAKPTARATTRATAQPTTEPTEAATEATAVEATEAATESANATEIATEAGDQGPITFAKAPGPDTGSIGITVAPDDNPVTLLSILPDGPADKAGLQPGDEIVAVNGKSVKTRQEIINMIVATKPGQTITFTINRDNKKQDIKVSVETRRKVYCPLPEPTVNVGSALVKDPLSAQKNWALDSQSTKGVKVTVDSGKLSFTPADPNTQWVGLATLRGKAIGDVQFSVDITQTGPAVAGLLFNFNARSGDYGLQLLPNGSWSISAVVDQQTASGGLSFSEPDLKATDDTSPNGTVTNTVGVTIQSDNIYLYFNGKFACGAALTNFSDPPLDPGAIGVYAVVGKDPTAKSGVVFSNMVINEIKK